MFSLATCGLVALSLVALAGLIYFLLRYLYWRVDPFYANIPHIPPEVLFGSVRHMGLMSGLSIGEGIAHLHNRLGRPPMMQLWLGKHHVISLHDPDYIKTLFSHHNIFLGKTPLMDAVTLPIFTEGSIINFDGEQHRRLASTVIPVLKRHKLGLWTPLIQHKADRLIQMWQLKAGGRTERLFSHQVNIEADFQLPVMDVVNTLILGSDMRAIDEKILSIVKNEKDSEQDGFPTMPSFSTSDRKTSAELVWSVQQVNNEFGKVTVTALPPFLSKLRLKLSPSYRKALSLLSNRIDRLFELSLTLQAPEEDEGDNIDVEGTNTTTTTAAGVAPTVSPVVPTDGTGDFVHWETFQHTALFRFGRAIASNTISRPLALNNLFSLSSAAGETVIATLCWMTWYLTSYPEVQEKCRQELREHGLMPEDINAPPPDLSASALDELTYLDGVVKESFRLGFASVGAFRRTSQPTDLIGGIPLRANQQIWWVGTTMHHDSKQFTKEEDFKPERYDLKDGSDSQHHPYAFLPFGGGVHGCPGKLFGWAIIKVLLARMMQRGVQFERTLEHKEGHFSRLSIFPKHLKPDITFKGK